MRLSLKDKLSYASAAIGDAATYSVVGTFLMFFLTTIVHIDPAVAGFLIGIGSIWDVAFSPVIGFWSDNCNAKMGRRRPFLLIGATLLAVSCGLLFHTVNAGSTYKAAYYGVMVIVFWTGFSTFYVPYLALGAEVTDNYNERTQLRSYAYGFNILGTLIGIVFPSVIIDLFISAGLSAEYAWQITGAIIGITSAISIYITFFLAKEKNTYKANIGKAKSNAIQHFSEMFHEYLEVIKLKPIKYLLAASVFYLIANTMYGADRLYYYTYKLGLSAVTVTAILLFASFNGILFMPVIMKLSRYFDKRSLLIIMLLISAVLMTSAKITGIHTIIGILVFTFVYGIGSGAYWQLMPSMIYDICEYDELETGKRREGSIVSLQSIAEAFAEASAMQILGVILQLAGFNGKAAVQTPLALEWVENSIMVIPSIFMILTVVMVFQYPITKKKYEEIQAELLKSKQQI